MGDGDRWHALLRLLLVGSVVAHKGEQYRIASINAEGKLQLRAISPSTQPQEWEADPVEAKLERR